jgi:hypothetical protein
MSILFALIKGGNFNDDDQPQVIRFSSDEKKSLASSTARVTQRLFSLHTLPVMYLHEGNRSKQ